MSCQEYRERFVVSLADPSEPAGDHAESCPECGRYVERARTAWEAAGKCPDDSVPAELSMSTLRSCRRPRGTDLTLLRPVSFAAAAILAAALLLLLRSGGKVKEVGPLYEADGMSVERYDLPAGVEAAAVALELRKEVCPEAWGEGGSGLEVGNGWLRVQATPEVHRAVRSYLRRFR